MAVREGSFRIALALIVGLLFIGGGTLLAGLGLAWSNMGAVFTGVGLISIGFFILKAYYTTTRVDLLCCGWALARLLLLGALLSAYGVQTLWCYILVLVLDYVVLGLAHYLDRYVFAVTLRPAPLLRRRVLMADSRDLDFV